MNPKDNMNVFNGSALYWTKNTFLRFAGSSVRGLMPKIFLECFVLRRQTQSFDVRRRRCRHHHLRLLHCLEIYFGTLWLHRAWTWWVVGCHPHHRPCGWDLQLWYNRKKFPHWSLKSSNVVIHILLFPGMGEALSGIFSYVVDVFHWLIRHFGCWWRRCLRPLFLGRHCSFLDDSILSKLANEGTERGTRWSMHRKQWPPYHTNNVQ